MSVINLTDAKSVNSGGSVSNCRLKVFMASPFTTDAKKYALCYGFLVGRRYKFLLYATGFNLTDAKSIRVKN